MSAFTKEGAAAAQEEDGELTADGVFNRKQETSDRFFVDRCRPSIGQADG